MYNVYFFLESHRQPTSVGCISSRKLASETAQNIDERKSYIYDTCVANKKRVFFLFGTYFMYMIMYNILFIRTEKCYNL